MTETHADHIRAAARTIAAERLRQPVDDWQAVAAHVATTEADADAIAVELARLADTLKDPAPRSAAQQMIADLTRDRDRFKAERDALLGTNRQLAEGLRDAQESEEHLAEQLRNARRKLNAATTPAYVHHLLDAYLTGQPLNFRRDPVPLDVQRRLEHAVATGQMGTAPASPRGAKEQIERTLAAMHATGGVETYRATDDRAADQTNLTQDLVAALADCVVKAVEHGEQDGGFVAFYLLPTGPIHRAIALLQQRHGITVRPGFVGREVTDASLQTDWQHEIAFDDDGTWSIGHPDGCPGQAGGNCDVARLATQQLASLDLQSTRLIGHRYRCAVGDLGDHFLIGDRIDEPAATLAQIERDAAQLDDDLVAGRVADRLGDPPPNPTGGSRCTCPQVDVSPLHEPPGTRTVPGYPAPACSEHGWTKPKHDHTTGYPTFAPDAELVVSTTDGPQQWTGARWNEHVHAAWKARNGVLELLRICPTPTCTTACPANPARTEG